MSYPKPGPGGHYVWCAHGHSVPNHMAVQRDDGLWVCDVHYEESRATLEQRRRYIPADEQATGAVRFDRVPRFIRPSADHSAIPGCFIPGYAWPGVNTLCGTVKTGNNEAGNEDLG